MSTQIIEGYSCAFRSTVGSVTARFKGGAMSLTNPRVDRCPVRGSCGLGVLLLLAVFLAVAADCQAAEFASQSERVHLFAKAADQTVNVIVGLAEPMESFIAEGMMADPTSVASQRRKIVTARHSLLDALSGYDAKRYKEWDSLPYVALQVNARALDRLASLPGVRTITEDSLNDPFLGSAMPHIGANVSLASGFDGAGQTVVILDTGIDADHPFFGNRVVDEACFSASNGNVSLCPSGNQFQAGPGAADALTAQCRNGASFLCTHGTHVAGIAAGADPGPPSAAPGAINGVAPAANLIAIQVFTRFNAQADCSPDPAPCVKAYTSDIMDALNYVNTTLRPTWNIASVNMSLGGGMYAAICDLDPRKLIHA